MPRDRGAVNQKRAAAVSSDNVLAGTTKEERDDRDDPYDRV